MIASLLEDRAEAHPDRPFVVGPSGEVYTYRDSLERVRAIARELAPSEPARRLVRMPDSPRLVFVLLASDAVGGTVAVASEESTESELSAVRERVSADSVITAATFDATGQDRIGAGADGASVYPRGSEEPVAARGEGKIIVLTTGTTGTPKGAEYPWSRLCEKVVRKDELEGERWLLTYHLNHFAGIQVLLHVLCNGGTLVVPDSRDPATVLETIREQEIGYVSGTPTFWRLFLGSIPAEELRRCELEHITIGGEAVTEDVLERIEEYFPDTRVSQMYVTTELGVCFTVRDGEPGFPRSFLERDDLPVRLKIVDGELHVRSSHGMERYYADEPDQDDGWFATGDLVEIDGDRVRFLGRKAETVNVGGRKVHPQEVEEVILGVSEVLAARVRGRSNPITGQVVGAEVVLTREADPERAREEIGAACAEKLERFKRPRALEFVEELPTANQKILRRAGS